MGPCRSAAIGMDRHAARLLGVILTLTLVMITGIAMTR
jgi:hypothetical protein